MIVELKEMRLLKAWDGTLVLELREGCTKDNYVVIKSDYYTQGGVLYSWDFTEGELEEVKEDLWLERRSKED